MQALRRSAAAFAERDRRQSGQACCAAPAPKPAPPAEAASVAVPVMGRIAAGVPISAIQNNMHDISVPVEMIGSGEHYASRSRAIR